MVSTDLIERGEGDDGTLDAYFWSTLLSNLKGKSVHAKSIGNKPTLFQIAQELLDRKVDTIIVCADADFSPLDCAATPPTNIVLTYGYSWENDTFEMQTLQRLYQSLFGASDRSKQLFEEFRVDFAKMSCELIALAELEFCLIRRGCSVFDRRKPSKNLTFANGLPHCRHGLTEEAIQRASLKRRPQKRVSQISQVHPYFAFGKVVALSAFHTFSYYAKRHSKDVDLSFPVFCRMAVTSLGERVRLGAGPVETYYRSAIS